MTPAVRVKLVAARAARTAAAGAAIAMALVLGGCGARNFTNENDRLRAANLELQRQVDRLQAQLELRVAQIDAMQQEAVRDRPEELRSAEVPRAVSLRLDRHSGPLRTGDSDYEDLLRLYVRPLDQRGRFLPVAGQATVQAVALRPGKEPVVVGELTVSPDDWERAYRSGLTGTHYTLELPLREPPEGARELAVHVNFTDAATGAILTRTQAFALSRRGALAEPAPATGSSSPR